MCLEEEGLRGEREEGGGCGLSNVRKSSPKVGRRKWKAKGTQVVK